MRRLEEKKTVKGDEVAFVADPAEIVVPGFVKSHGDGGHLIAGAELRSKHGSERFRLQDALAVEFAAIQKSLTETPHIAGG